MYQLSAYNLLQEFSNCNEVEILSYNVNSILDVIVLEIDPVLQNFNQNRVLNNKFLSQHFYTCNSFIQRIQYPYVKTDIATMGVPFAPEINEINYLNQDQIYNTITNNLKDSSFTITEIQHNSKTISISFCIELNAFCISCETQTIFCQNQKDLDLFQEPMHERPNQVAIQFFKLFNRMPKKLQESFKQDLIDRSLIGCYNLTKQIEWFAIVEHYSQQRMIDPNTVINFLNHYQFKSASIKQNECSYIQLQNYFSQIHNQKVDSFHYYYKGKTLYFWKKNIFLGCCFIPCKQQSIFNQLSFMLLKIDKYNKEFNEPYKYLSKFNLNDQDFEYYTKFTDLMLENLNIIKSKKTFSQVSTQVLNSIKEKQEYKKKQQDIPIFQKQCIQPTIIVVVIPLGISGMGYDKLCSNIEKAGQKVQIIKMTNQINDKNQLYFYEKVCNPKELKQINTQLKQLPFQIQTIALLPECNSFYYGEDLQCNFPFSFNFIIFCLLSVLENRNLVKEIISQLQEYKDQKFNNIQTDYQIYCRFIPESLEKDNIYSEQVEQQFISSLQSYNDQFIEILTQYKYDQSKFIDDYLKHESKRIILDIEKKTKLNLNKCVQFQIEEDLQLKYGLFIEKPDWEVIDNFVKSCLEIIVQHYPNDSRLNKMYHNYESQFQSQNAIFKKINKPFLQARQLYEKPIQAKISILVIIIDGIIVLQPDELGLNLLQDIPIYFHNIDILKSNKVSEQFMIDVKKMQKQNEEEQTIKKLQVSINRKQWDTYIVKFRPIYVKLVSGQII